MNDSVLACALTLAAIIIVSVYQPWNPKRLPPGPPRKLFGTRTTPGLPPYQLFALMHKKFGGLILRRSRNSNSVAHRYKAQSSLSIRGKHLS